MKILASVVAAVVSLTAVTGFAADGVGEALAVVDTASASGQVGDRRLAIGSEVFLGDTVSTDSGGEAQLVFVDGTRMVIGANSSLVIDEFLFRSEAADNKFSVRALGGVFRFISGQSGERAYSIQTPSGTIGVRGTAFDFTVDGNDAGLVLLKGAAILCTWDGNCETVTMACQVVRIYRNNHVEIVHSPKMRLQRTRRKFPYQVSQSGLLSAFRINGKGCAEASADGAAGRGGNGGGGGDGVDDSGGDVGSPNG